MQTKEFPAAQHDRGTRKTSQQSLQLQDKKLHQFLTCKPEKVIPLPSALLRSSNGFGRLPAKPQIHLTPKTKLG